MDVRLAAIGLGGLGSIELDCCAAIDGVTVVAGADISPAARESFAETHDAPAYEDYERLLAEHADDVDAVVIVTPHTLHHEQAMACMERGLDVFLEKPMVTDLTDAVELVETADRLDRVLQVGYQRHFDPLYREIREVVQSGRIGEVHMVACYLGQDWIDTQEGTWRTDPSLSGGGELYDSGSHLLDALLWTTGTTPGTVAATMDYREGDVDVNAALAATLERDGRPVTASIGVCGDGLDISPSEGLFVWGTEGRVDFHDGELRIVEGGEETRREPPGEDFEATTRRKMEHFVSVVRGEAELAGGGEFGLEVTALTEAAYRAYETGSTVDVPELVEETERAVADAAEVE
jgi:predicted dehydrogenase